MYAPTRNHVSTVDPRLTSYSPGAGHSAQNLRASFRESDLSQLRETLSHLGETAVVATWCDPTV
jgi:hypothetical protein